MTPSNQPLASPCGGDESTANCGLSRKPEYGYQAPFEGTSYDDISPTPVATLSDAAKNGGLLRVSGRKRRGDFRLQMEDAENGFSLTY